MNFLQVNILFSHEYNSDFFIEKRQIKTELLPVAIGSFTSETRLHPIFMYC